MIGSVQFACLRKGIVKSMTSTGSWLAEIDSQSESKIFDPYFDQKSDYRRNDEYCMISGFGRTQGKSYFTQL